MTDIIQYRYLVGDPKLDVIIDMLSRLSTALNIKGNAIMATLADITDAITHEATVEAGVVTLLQTLSADLQAAIANGNDPVALQTIVDTVNANAKAMADAVVANTPAAPAPAPDPVPTPDPAAP